MSSSVESGDKVTRAEPLASQINVGNVALVRGPWNYSFVAEMRNFPFGKHDDQIDAASRGFNFLMEANGPVLISAEGAAAFASLTRRRR